MVSEVKGSLKKQPSKCQTNTSINSLEQEDQVNISVSGSMADINLDMNPYLF